MKGYLKRSDDFETRREHLRNLSDDELKARFWELAGNIVDPMIDLAKTHTTPSIERSVLLRMGFSSLEVKPLVEGAIDRGLVGHGVGHLVYRVSKDRDVSVRDAGLQMIEGDHWDYLVDVFKGGER